MQDETDEQFAKGWIGWLDKRLGWHGMSIPLYVGVFRKNWIERFGNEDNVPQWLKDRSNAKWHEYMQEKIEVAEK